MIKENIIIDDQVHARKEKHRMVSGNRPTPSVSSLVKDIIMTLFVIFFKKADA